MFFWTVSPKDLKELAVLFEDMTTGSGLIESWGEGKQMCNHFDKRCLWLGSGADSAVR